MNRIWSSSFGCSSLKINNRQLAEQETQKDFWGWGKGHSPLHRLHHNARHGGLLSAALIYCFAPVSVTVCPLDALLSVLHTHPRPKKFSTWTSPLRLMYCRCTRRAADWKSRCVLDPGGTSGNAAWGGFNSLFGTQSSQPAAATSSAFANQMAAPQTGGFGGFSSSL